MIAAADLNALLDDLDRLGLETGPAARQRAHLLFAGLAGTFPDDAEAAKQVLADHLKPLIVKRSEQALTYDRGVAAWTGLPPPPDPDQPHAFDTPRPAPKRKRRGIPVRFLSAIAAIAIVIALVPWSASRFLTQEEIPVTTDPGRSQSVSEPSGNQQQAEVPSPSTPAPPPSQPRELSNQIGSADELDRVMIGIIITALNHDLAPTLNEYAASGAVGDLSARELSDLTGIPENQPVPTSGRELVRIILAALTNADMDTTAERAFRSIGRERDLTEMLLYGNSRDELDDFVSILQARDDQLSALGLTRDMLQFTETGILDNSKLVRVLDRLIQPLILIDDLPAEPSRFDIARFLPGENAIIVAFDEEIWTLTRNGAAGVWTPELVTRLQYAPTALEVSPDGQLLLIGARQEQQLLYMTRLTDGGWSDPPFVLEGDAAIDMSFSADSRRVATVKASGDVQIWTRSDSGRLEELVSLSHPNAAFRVALSRDGSLLASITEDGIPQIWTEDERGSWRSAFLFTSQGDSPLSTELAFSPDRDRLVSTGDDGELYSWRPGPDGEWSGRLVHTFADEIGCPVFAPDGGLLFVCGGRRTVDIIRSGDEGELSPVSTLSFERDVRLIDVDPAGDGVLTLAPGRGPSIWSREPLPAPGETIKLADFVNWLRDRDAQTEAIDIPETVSDEKLARIGSALMYRAGTPIRIEDAPWLADEAGLSGSTGWLERHLASLVAGILVLLGFLFWLRSALSQRGYLQRRRPGDAGRVIELFSEARGQAERAQLAIRQAAKSLLGRQPGASRIDILGSVRATARSAGLFTPVEKRETRLPEYLFLIDSRSRADHETQRTLDYVERLRREHVPVRAFFFERAPDRVRQGDGMPSVPLDQIASEHSEKRLVLVGDAATMITPDSVGDGHWVKALESWRSKAFVTTVSPDEWGPDEKAFAAKTGLSANVLSAKGLENLPAILTGEQDTRPGETSVSGSLDVPPLPTSLRRQPDRWVHGRDPGDEAYQDLEADLIAYLGMPGFRWLCACAVYPLIEWDLTVALGQVLNDSSAEPIYTESRAARLAELPWMRAGDMPDWLRGRLIDAIDPEDEQEVKALIARILSAVETSGPVGEDAIRLKFGHLRGRQADDDEKFVSFVTKSPDLADRRALEATRKLRNLLRPSLASRFANPRGLAALAGGIGFAAIAWFLVPEPGPSRSNAIAWFPLTLLLLVPLAGWIITKFGAWLVHYLVEFARNLYLDIRGIPGTFGIWLQTLLGLAGGLADSDDARSRGRAVTIMRNRLETWTALFLATPVFIAVLFAYFLGLEAWRAGADLISGPLAALRQALPGELALTLLSVAMLVGLIYLATLMLRLVHRATVWITDLAARRNPDLSGQAPDPVLRILSIAGAGLIIMSLDVIANQIGLSGALSPASDGGSGRSLIDPVFGSILLFQLIVGILVVHHWITLRRFASRLKQRWSRPNTDLQAEAQTTEAAVEETLSRPENSAKKAAPRKMAESVS